MTLRIPWWRHQMETFSALLAICAGNSPVTGEFPTQRPVTRGFDVFFDLCLHKRLSKQWLGWLFDTPSRPLWRHCNAKISALGQLSMMCLLWVHVLSGCFRGETIFCKLIIRNPNSISINFVEKKRHSTMELADAWLTDLKCLFLIGPIAHI